MKHEPLLTYSDGIWFALFDPRKHVVPVGCTLFSFTRTHLPTKQLATQSAVCLGKDKVDVLIDRWNRQQPRMWKYQRLT